MSGPLDPVWEWYVTARDSMRIALRVAEKGIDKAVTSNHALHGLSASDAASRIKAAQQELDNMAVVAMAAVFERTPRDYLADRVVPHLTVGDPFDQGVRDQVEEDIEFWHISSRAIDRLFKHRVSGDHCGLIKQILDHRNKVAHGHVRASPPPTQARPATAYQRLSAFLRDGGVVSP